MSKMLTLLSTTVLTLAAVIAYVLIDEKIVAGEKMMDEGQELIRQQLPDLATGKAELASGKQALAAGKKGIQASSRQQAAGAGRYGDE
jgi:hypothetical protein